MKTTFVSALLATTLLTAAPFALGHDGEIYEPGKGTAFSGIGNNKPDADLFETASGFVTAHERFYMKFNSQNPTHPVSTPQLVNKFNNMGNQGQIPKIGLDYKGFHPSFLPMDQAITFGMEDAFLDLLADACILYGKPLFIMPGFEFNLVGYTPEIFPDSFDYIVEHFRNRGVKNVAWVWNAFIEETATTQYDDKNPVTGEWLWLPKTTSINWMAMNIFKAEAWIKGSQSQNAVIMQEFVDFAESFDKPILYAETTGLLGTDILDTADPGAQANADFIWNNHLSHLFENIECFDRIKGFTYISTDWPATGNPLWATWGDQTITNNQFLLNLFLAELNNGQYVNAGDSLPHPWIPWLEQSVAPGDLANIDIHNLQPFEQAVLFLSPFLLPDGVNIGGVQGDWFLAPPVFFLLALPADATGEINLPVPLPNDASLSGFTFYLQWVSASGAPKPQKFNIL